MQAAAVLCTLLSMIVSEALGRTCRSAGFYSGAHSAHRCDEGSGQGDWGKLRRGGGGEEERKRRGGGGAEMRKRDTHTHTQIETGIQTEVFKI